MTSIQNQTRVHPLHTIFSKRSIYATLTLCATLSFPNPATAGDESGPVVVRGSVNVATDRQSGGGNIPFTKTIPIPGLRLGEDRGIARNAEGTFTRSISIEILDGFLADSLVVTATGPTVIGVNVSPAAGGRIAGVRQGNLGSQYFYELSEKPAGQYIVSVKTTDGGSAAAPLVVFKLTKQSSGHSSSPPVSSS